MTSRPRESRGDTRFALAVGLGFLLLAALGMAYHELWRDEWQSWLIATQSDSFGELIQRIKDESHTPLWLLCLYAIGKLTDRPEAMQAFHLLIATTSVFVFARYAPFRRWERALFPLGYFMLYEYAIISRHYGLGVLFVVLFCATLRRGNYLLSTTLLAGLAWSSHQGILIAVPLQLMLLLRSNRPIGSRGRWMRAGVSCLFLLALIVAVLVVVPPRLAEDHYLYTGVDPQLEVRSINTVWNAYVPVPHYEDGRVVWNTNFLGTFNAWVSSNPEAPPAIPWTAPLSSREVVALLLSLVLLLGAVRALAPDRTIMIVFSLTTLAMLLFSYSVFFGWMRQHGHLYLAFVACLWIARDVGPADGADREPGGRLRWFLPVLLIAQAAGGMAIYAADLVRPFTSSSEVASFLQRGGLAEYPLVGDPDFLLTPLSGLLDRPFWSLETGEATTSTVWKAARYPRDLDLLKRMRKALRISGSNAALLITSYSVEAAVGAGEEQSPRIGIQLTYLAWFRPAMVPDEHYVVYYLQPAGRALPDKISELALQDPIEY